MQAHGHTSKLNVWMEDGKGEAVKQSTAFRQFIKVENQRVGLQLGLRVRLLGLGLELGKRGIGWLLAGAGL